MTRPDGSESLDEKERVVRASARLEKAQQVERDRELVWKEIAENARKSDDNTARLKALRLEKERAEAEARKLEAATAKPPRSRKKAVSR